MTGKSFTAAVLTLSLAFTLAACGRVEDAVSETTVPAPAGAAQPTAAATDSPEDNQKEDAPMIYAHVGENVLAIIPEDNSSAEDFIALLREGDITIEMEDYGGFEKVGSLGRSLSTNDRRITTEPGDVILYQGNSITIYYDTNTWSFTLLGRIQGLSQEDLKDILGEGSVSVTFSLNESP